MPASIDDLPERLRELLDTRVFQFAQAAQRHFRTNDLVVALDFRDDAPSLEALPRQALAEATELALDIRLKLARPAGPVLEDLGDPAQVFWFVVIHEDEDADCGAVVAAVADGPG